MRVFIDSDVVISSLLSSSGAAYFLFRQANIRLIISSLSIVELRIVAKRIGIRQADLETLVKDRFEVFKITSDRQTITQDYERYVSDINDAHIVAGAHGAKVNFLISYNLKHFKSDKIKDELDILVMTPALFLQYLRSL